MAVKQRLSVFLLYELQTYADTQNASVLSVIILLIVLVGNLILNKVSRVMSVFN